MNSDPRLAAIERQGVLPVMPPNAHRHLQRAYDKTLYQARNVMARTFSKRQQYRRLATRYARQSHNSLARLYLATLNLWLT